MNPLLSQCFFWFGLFVVVYAIHWISFSYRLWSSALIVEYVPKLHPISCDSAGGGWIKSEYGVPLTYRGFLIGYILGPNGYKARWFHPSVGWCDGYILVNTLEEVVQIAQDCIDFQYKIQVFEVINDRQPTVAELKQL